MIFYSTFVEAPKKLCRLNQQHWIEIQIDVLKQQQQKLQYSRVGHRVIIQTFPLKGIGMPISLQGVCINYQYNNILFLKDKNVSRYSFDRHLLTDLEKKYNHVLIRQDYLKVCSYQHMMKIHAYTYNLPTWYYVLALYFVVVLHIIYLLFKVSSQQVLELIVCAQCTCVGLFLGTCNLNEILMKCFLFEVFSQHSSQLHISWK